MADAGASPRLADLRFCHLYEIFEAPDGVHLRFISERGKGFEVIVDNPRNREGVPYV